MSGIQPLGSSGKPIHWGRTWWLGSAHTAVARSAPVAVPHLTIIAGICDTRGSHQKVVAHVMRRHDRGRGLWSRKRAQQPQETSS